MRNRNVTVLVAVVVLALCFGLPRTDAIVYFDDGGTYDIDYEIDDTVYVDFGAPGMETTVNLLSGGSIVGTLAAYNDSQVNVSGGSIGNVLEAKANSHVNVSGGSIGSSLIAGYNSQVTVSGGSIGIYIYAGWDSGGPHESVITFVGSDFAIDGASVDYGQYFTSDYASGTLTGTLDSGDPLNNNFEIWDNSSIVLVPEPGTLFLLGLGAVMLRRRR